MIVRIRFGSGRLITDRKGKNGRAARLISSLLTLLSISLGTLAFWKLGQDLEFLNNFVFSSGFLSHWQVWAAAAGGIQYAAWRLICYSRQEPLEIEAELVPAPVQAEERREAARV